MCSTVLPIFGICTFFVKHHFADSIGIVQLFVFFVVCFRFGGSLNKRLGSCHVSNETITESSKQETNSITYNKLQASTKQPIKKQSQTRIPVQSPTQRAQPSFFFTSYTYNLDILLVDYYMQVIAMARSLYY